MPAFRIRYQTIEIGDVDIHLRTLRDRQQYDDPDHIAEDLGISSATWPIFGIVWPSGEVLAQFMSDFQIEGKRILEVGCGIGLTSLLSQPPFSGYNRNRLSSRSGRFSAGKTPS